MFMNRSRLAFRALGLLCLACLVVVAAGCGGGPDSSSASSQGDASTTADQTAEFTECLREHGVEAFGQGQGPGNQSEEDRAAFAEAMSACRDLAPEGFGPGGSAPADSEQMAEYRDCLEENGVTGFGGGQGGPPAPGSDAQGGGGGALSDAEREKLQAAREACQSLAPEGLGRPGGGFPGAGGAQNAEYRECMAEHGVTLGEQNSAGQEAFRKATEACGKLLEQPESGNGSS